MQRLTCWRATCACRRCVPHVVWFYYFASQGRVCLGSFAARRFRLDTCLHVDTDLLTANTQVPIHGLLVSQQHSCSRPGQWGRTTPLGLQARRQGQRKILAHGSDDADSMLSPFAGPTSFVAAYKTSQQGFNNGEPKPFHHPGRFEQRHRARRRVETRDNCTVCTSAASRLFTLAHHASRRGESAAHGNGC